MPVVAVANLAVSKRVSIKSVSISQYNKFPIVLSVTIENWSVTISLISRIHSYSKAYRTFDSSHSL